MNKSLIFGVMILSLLGLAFPVMGTAPEVGYASPTLYVNLTNTSHNWFYVNITSTQNLSNATLTLYHLNESTFNTTEMTISNNSGTGMPNITYAYINITESAYTLHESNQSQPYYYYYLWYSNDTTYFNFSDTNQTYIGMDFTAPNEYYRENFTIANATGGDWLAFNVTFRDNTTTSCYYDIYYRENVYTSSDTLVTSGTGTITSHYSSSNYTCEFNISGTDLTSGDGYYIVTYNASDGSDDAANLSVTGAANTTSGTNQTMIALKLIGNRWNAIGFLNDDNETTYRYMDWVGNHSTITYFSWLNNANNTWVTHTFGGGLNNETQINISDGAAYVYPSADSWLIRHNYSVFASPTSVNISAVYWSGHTNTTWTLTSLWYDNLTRNLTLDINDTISFVSYHNITNGYYYTFQRGFELEALNVTALKGTAVWIQSNETTWSTATWDRAT